MITLFPYVRQIQKCSCAAHVTFSASTVSLSRFTDRPRGDRRREGHGGGGERGVRAREREREVVRLPNSNANNKYLSSAKSCP